MWWRTRHGRGPPARHHLLEQLPGPAEHPCRVPLAAAHTPGTAPFSRPGLNTHERSGEEPFKRSSKAQNPRSNTAPASLQRSRTLLRYSGFTRLHLYPLAHDVHTTWLLGVERAAPREGHDACGLKVTDLHHDVVGLLGREHLRVLREQRLH